MHSKITNREITVRILQTVSLICVAAILFCTLALVATVVLVPVGVILGVGIPVSVMFLIGNPIPPSQIPTIQIYMPQFLIEMRLNAEFQSGMSKEEVKEKISQTDWLKWPSEADRGVYIDKHGNATYYYEEACSSLGVTSIEANIGNAPLVVCIAYFAFDENDRLIKVKADQEILLY